jgi:hypothetical protein
MAVVTTGPGTLYIAPDIVWQGWNQNYVYTTTGSTTGSAVWQNWNQTGTSIGTAITAVGLTNSWIQWNVTYTEADAEILEQRRREQQEAAERCRQQQEESRRLVEEAKHRAEELLTALLSNEQAETWRLHRWFEVHGSRTGRTYRIRHGIAHNVNLMDGEQAEVNYCAHPPGVPAEDVCLAQMFLLCTDEDAFLAVANARPLNTARLRAVETETVRTVPAEPYERPLPVARLHAVA